MTFAMRCKNITESKSYRNVWFLPKDSAETYFFFPSIKLFSFIESVLQQDIVVGGVEQIQPIF